MLGYLLPLGTVPFVQSRTLIHEWNSKITVSAKSSCQQEQVLFSQYLSQVKKVLWTQLYFVYFERVWEHTKKKASTAVLLQRPADTQTSHVVSEERETPSESSGTTSGLNCALKTSGSFLCVQEESLLKHSWCLWKVGVYLELCSWNYVMNKVSPKSRKWIDVTAGITLAWV